MPKVYTADVNNLLDQAMRKFEQESGRRPSDSYPIFFSLLADEVNTETGSSLKGDTLYKHFYLRLRSFDEVTIGYSWSYLNALSQYTTGKDYRHANPILKNSVEDIQAAVKRVDYDKLKGSEDDPLRPEFPPNNPAFPATPTRPIRVPGFSNVWLKDESHNLTGTHKDRMAWEIILYYRNFLARSALSGRLEKIPQLSIISSGCAALAIQTQLKYYNFPSLKVIYDRRLDDTLKLAMLKIGCETYELDLEAQELTSEDILRITENITGKDLTFGTGLEEVENTYYDWLSYEILNQSPDFCFIPYGSGGLYRNILTINQTEVGRVSGHDNRFFGRVDILRSCHFIGATTSNLQSKLDKLYSPFHHAWRYNGYVREAMDKGYCGSMSQIVEVQERFVDEAMKLAQAQNIDCEPSGIGGLALLLQLQDDVPKDKKILIVNTGRLKIAKYQ